LFNRRCGVAFGRLFTKVNGKDVLWGTYTLGFANSENFFRLAKTLDLELFLEDARLRILEVLGKGQCCTIVVPFGKITHRFWLQRPQGKILISCKIYLNTLAISVLRLFTT